MKRPSDTDHPPRPPRSPDQQFEDPWEDDLDDDAGDDGDEHAMDVDDDDEQPPPSRTFIPGQYALSKDEILEPDHSVYIALHSMGVHWPCLSFDILRDHLGNERARYPQSAFVVTGTQATSPKDNQLLLVKMSQLHRTLKDPDDSDDDDDDGDDDLDEDAVLEHRSVPHFGGINRVRAQPLPPGDPLPPPSQPYYVSTWADSGKVHIFNIRSLLESLITPGVTPTTPPSPVFTLTSHGRAEGFAMDWASSGSSSLRLLTGDIHAKIYLTTSTPSSFNPLSQPFTSHTSSVEDLQWSPTEPTIFASCSADASIRIWDVRVKGRKSAFALQSAHSADVNVISWNKSTSYLLLSGGDDAAINVWDLRHFKPAADLKPSPVASFAWHDRPITSVEWHPTEDSVFAASGEDDQVTLWDLSVEHDDDEAGVNEDQGSQGKDIPPQLLFVHQGQKEIKELHWHPQIPGAVISTAHSGLDFFKTISI